LDFHEAIPHITINVLRAFTDFLYDTLADKDIKKKLLGLLELAKSYFIEDLTSTVEKSLAGRSI
jgi:glycosylphosphatidylinositol transamidase (GPIT) subunit GPI8